MSTLAENVVKAISDFDHIKEAIEMKGVAVPFGTATANYGDLISQISDQGADLQQIADAATQLLTICNYSGGAVDETAEPFTSLINNGTSVFQTNEKITSWSAGLAALTIGYRMFNRCDNLTAFSTNLPVLTKAVNMFTSCSSLTVFNAALPLLIEGTNMFMSCNSLTSFTSDLSSLTSANNMFSGCLELTTFNADLPCLEAGDYMFSNCIKLTVESLIRILTTLPDRTHMTSGLIHIGLANRYKLNNTQLSIATNKNWVVE